jgi:ABC-type xylose transport system permease subunit
MKPAALAHLGERQTEVHFESPYHPIRFLEVLCSIHRSGISSRSFHFCFALAIHLLVGSLMGCKYFCSYAIIVVDAWIWRLCGHLFFRIWPRPVMTPESSLTIAALSMLMSTMVSATFVCQVAIYTRERAGFGYQYFIRWHCTKRKYQHLPYVTNMPVPVRYPFDKH